MMGYLDLYTSGATTFGGLDREFADADYVVIGVPFDATSTYRSGSRFAPLAIREASLNIETVYYMLVPDYQSLMDTQQRINLEVLRRFNEAGIDFAFPTRTVYVEGDSAPKT